MWSATASICREWLLTFAYYHSLNDGWEAVAGPEPRVEVSLAQSLAYRVGSLAAHSR